MKNTFSRADLITIIAQGYYGNRTMTEIRREEIDKFIAGDHSTDGIQRNDYHPEDRQVIHIPGTDNLVLIYNKFREDKWLEYARGKEWKSKPAAVIPELGLEICTCCIVCRIDPDGTFQSLEPEDLKKFINYLAE